MATLVKEARPARALSSVAGISPSVRARCTPIRRRLRGHPAGASQPGHRGAAAIGLGTAIRMKAVQATQALGLELIDREPDLDDVGAQFGGRDTVDGLIDECVGSLTQALLVSVNGVRFHAHILPNICSLTASAGPNTDI